MGTKTFRTFNPNTGETREMTEAEIIASQQNQNGGGHGGIYAPDEAVAEVTTTGHRHTHGFDAEIVAVITTGDL